MINSFTTIFRYNSGIKLIGAFTKVLFMALLFSLSCISVSLSGQTLAKTNQLHIKHNSGSLLPVNTVSPNAKQVTVGIYSANIYDMDLRANTFNMSFHAAIGTRCNPGMPVIGIDGSDLCYGIYLYCIDAYTDNLD